jgi:hypothetical protein
MKRDPALVSLSHEHHQALFVAQQLRRATNETAHAVRTTFLDFWTSDGEPHFRIEEQVLLPAFAAHGDAHHPLVARALCDHVAIRATATQIERDDDPDPATLRELGARLAAHVRLEERQLFPLIERAMPTPALGPLAAALSEADAQHRGGDPD